MDKEEKQQVDRRTKMRDRLLRIMIIVSFPVWLSVYVKICSFSTVASLLSLIPGLLGLWLRRSFYYMTLTDAPTDISIEFGSRFLGRGVRLGSGVWTGNWTSINDCTIGKGTIVGSCVDIFSGAHQHGSVESLMENKSETPMALPEKLVTIGENVWIGRGAVVFADVGDNTIIGAGSVVVKPIPANCVAAGNPARVLKTAQQ
jgi:acetyltransferase-like isoleucine patch superfamily enzyme